MIFFCTFILLFKFEVKDGFKLGLSILCSDYFPSCWRVPESVGTIFPDSLLNMIVAGASRLFSIVGTLRSVCEIEGTPSSPAVFLFIESRIFLVALFEPSPPPASLALKILASALLLISSSAFSVSLVLPEPA